MTRAAVPWGFHFTEGPSSTLTTCAVCCKVHVYTEDRLPTAFIYAEESLWAGAVRNEKLHSHQREELRRTVPRHIQTCERKLGNAPERQGAPQHREDARRVNVENPPDPRISRDPGGNTSGLLPRNWSWSALLRTNEQTQQKTREKGEQGGATRPPRYQTML